MAKPKFRLVSNEEDRKNTVKPIVVDLDRDRTALSRERLNRGRWALLPKGDEIDEALAEADLLDEWEGTVQVLSFDPGGTTGWSLFEVQPEAVSGCPEHRNVGVLKNVVRWRHGQIDCGSRRGNLGTSRQDGVSTTGENAGIGEMIGLIRNWPNAAVVIEDFILDPDRFNTGRDLLSPVRITSALSYDLWLQGREPFFQSASLAKTSCRDEQLKSWGFYDRSGGLNHARDADRHGLSFLRRAATVTMQGYRLRRTAWPGLYGPGGDFFEAAREKRINEAEAENEGHEIALGSSLQGAQEA